MSNETTSDRIRRENLGALEDLPVDSMRMARVGERRVVVVRTATGVHALDNACPHQGYGLATGQLDGELLTCQWHNWKFDVSTGTCVMGEEDVACHAVEIVDGEIEVTVVEPTDEEIRAQVFPSLTKGVEEHQVGQIARDTARLLEAGAEPADVMWVGLEHAFPRERWGPGHGMATAVDCLAFATNTDNDDRRVLATVQGLTALAEPTRARPARTLPPAGPGEGLGAAIEHERLDDAIAAARGLARGPVDDARSAFIEATSQHHLSYGHGMIYTQKAFELLERTGWEHADTVLANLAVSITWSTREDTLPYMRKAMRAIEGADLDRLAAIAPDPEWVDTALPNDLLDAADAPIGRALDALAAGAGVERLLDAVVDAVSVRMLRHDIELEVDPDESFGWLDITHGLTLARAARWAWRNAPGPDTVRQALFAVWLCHDTGRAERERGIARTVDQRGGAELARSIRLGDVEATLGAIASDPSGSTETLIESALADGAGSFIVTAHLIKLTQACIEEFEHSGSVLPLLAAGRFLAAPRAERFVANNVAEAIGFVRTGKPPAR